MKDDKKYKKTNARQEFAIRCKKLHVKLIVSR